MQATNDGKQRARRESTRRNSEAAATRWAAPQAQERAREHAEGDSNNDEALGDLEEDDDPSEDLGGAEEAAGDTSDALEESDGEGGADDDSESDGEQESTSRRRDGRKSGANSRANTSGAPPKRKSLDGDPGGSRSQKKPKTSKQPPWTKEQELALLQIADFVDHIGWKAATEIPTLSAHHCEVQTPPWPQRQGRSVQMKLQRLRNSQSKMLWTDAEMHFLNDQRARKKTITEIHAEHQKRFGRQGLVRSKGAIKQKLQFLPPWDLASPVPPTVSVTGVSAHPKDAVAQPSGRCLVTTQRLWDPVEDQYLSQFVGKTGLSYVEIQKELGEIRIQHHLPHERSIRAVATRIRDLAKNPVRPRPSQRLVYWDAEHDDLVRQIIRQNLTRQEAVEEIVRQTQTLPTFAQHRWRQLRQEPAQEETKEESEPELRTLEGRLSMCSTDGEAADLRREQPDSWLSDYPTSCASGLDGGSSDSGEEEGPAVEVEPTAVEDPIQQVVEGVAAELVTECCRLNASPDGSEPTIEQVGQPASAARDVGAQHATGGDVEALRVYVDDVVMETGEDVQLRFLRYPTDRPEIVDSTQQQVTVEAQELCSQPAPSEPNQARLCSQSVPIYEPEHAPLQSRGSEEQEKAAEDEAWMSLASPPEEDQYSDDGGEGAARARVEETIASDQMPRGAASEAEGAEVDAEVQGPGDSSDDDLAAPVFEVMTPRATTIEDDEQEAAVREGAEPWLIKYWSSDSVTQLRYAERARVWDRDNAANTTYDPIRTRYIKRDTKYQFVSESKRLPRARLEHMKTLLFAITLLLRSKDALLAYLRELWGPKYGCRARVCCLPYNASDSEFPFAGECRHWEYLRQRHVYLDRFKDESDHMLALTLSIHRDAYEETTSPYREEEGGWTYHVLNPKSFGRADEMFGAWPDRDEAGNHVRPFLGSLQGLVLETSKSGSQWRRWQTGDYGELYHGSTTGPRTLIGRAMVIEIQYMKVMLTTASFRDLYAHKQTLVWSAKVNVNNYMRRADFLDRLPRSSYPMIQWFAHRRACLHARVKNVQKAALGTAQFEWVKQHADPDQLKVIVRALTHYGIILARGPYGCGKSTLITHLVSAYRAAFPRRRIAIVSETNAAIEEDMARLVKKGFVHATDVVRLGLPRLNKGATFKPDPKLRRCYLRCELDDYKLELRQRGIKGEEAETKITAFKEGILRERPVIVATLSQLGKPEYAKLQYHLVINDEGAQTSESSLAQAARAEVEALVIVGDPGQLMPYTPIKETEKERFSARSRRHKLGWSVMHHMMHAHRQETGQDVFPGITMTAEFRSHSRITSFLRPFYGYKLRDRATESESYLEDLILPTCRLQRSWFAAAERKAGERVTAQVTKRRVVWLSPVNSISNVQREANNDKSTKSRSAEGSNLLNRVEATAVLDLMLRIRAAVRQHQDREFPIVKKDVLIVTPYHSQRREIEYRLGPHQVWLSEYLQYTVETTDSSQGREAAITIVSLVRNTSLGFMKNYPARSLVSLSRARDYLFLLACHTTYGMDDTWHRLMIRADRIGVPCMELTWSTDEAEDRARRWRNMQRTREMYKEEETFLVAPASQSRE